MTVLTVDVSRYQGEITPTVLDALCTAGVRHTVVRLNFERDDWWALGERQVRAFQAAGFAVSAYHWCYWDQDPAVSAGHAGDVCNALGISWCWLDAEDGVPDGIDAGTWLRRAVEALRERGIQVGIYTGLWWWRPSVGDASAFADVPFWLADYDGQASLDTPLPDGASTLAAKQYTSSAVIGGVTFDLNVFDERFVPLSQEPGGVVQEQLLQLPEEEMDSEARAAAKAAQDAADQANFRIALASKALAGDIDGVIAAINAVRVALGGKPLQ